MRVVISNNAGIPIYEQIKEQIKTAILSGELKGDDLLPSVRQLARDLKISVITTMRAYADLEQEGFVVNVHGKGCYVQPQNSELIREQMLREVEAGLTAAISAARIAKLPKSELIDILHFLTREEGYE